jgi:hypothetical protein
VRVASHLVPLNDAQVTTVRHMQSQVWLQIVVVTAGYLLLAVGMRYARHTSAQTSRRPETPHTRTRCRQ